MPHQTGIPLTRSTHTSPLDPMPRHTHSSDNIDRLLLEESQYVAGVGGRLKKSSTSPANCGVTSDNSPSSSTIDYAIDRDGDSGETRAASPNVVPHDEGPEETAPTAKQGSPEGSKSV